MDKPHAITAELDEETLADLDRLAAHFGRSREHLITTSVLRFVDEEIGAITVNEFAHLPAPPIPPELQILDDARAAFDAWIKEGEDAIERGDFMSHEDFMAELRARYGSKRAA